jgi:predicted small metal-binding protein
MDCGFVARGKNIDETAQKMLVHFKQAHEDKYGKMDNSQRQALEQRIKELVH